MKNVRPASLMLACLVLTALVWPGRICPAQQSASAGARLLSDRGVTDAAPAVRDALDVLLAAQNDYKQGKFENAAGRLGAFWNTYPPGTKDWAALDGAGYQMGRTKGVFLGTPPCYYALRMLTEAVQWRLRSRSPAGNKKITAVPVTLSVILVGHAKGTQPRTKAELDAGGGLPALLALDRSLAADDYRIIRQSLWLFGEYVSAITDGRLTLRVEFVPLPELSIPLTLAPKGPHFGPLTDVALTRIWKSVPKALKSETDWWWILYPSIVPEQYPDFATSEFITGGMGRGPDGSSPCFLIDDRWLVRKPPHLSRGAYTDIERLAYLPQWLQHEFFHHLFALYPEFELEKTSHQWFDHKTWPADFQGVLEPDYYAEALHKRLIPRGKPALSDKLLYAASDPKIVRALNLKSLPGRYRHEPMENDWHEGEITKESTGVYRWTNRAGKSWRLSHVPGSLSLRTGRDNPYARSGDESQREFQLVLKRNPDGALLPEVGGFRFNSATYKKVEP